MIYSSHTFELTLITNAENFYKWKNKAYKKAKDNYRVFEIEHVHYDEALKDKGVKIEYHDDTFKKKIQFIVNPTKLLGGNDINVAAQPVCPCLDHQLGHNPLRYFATISLRGGHNGCCGQSQVIMEVRPQLRCGSYGHLPVSLPVVQRTSRHECIAC